MSPSQRRANMSQTRTVTKGPKEAVSRAMPRTRPDPHYGPSHIMDDISNAHFSLAAGHAEFYRRHVDPSWVSHNDYSGGIDAQYQNVSASACRDSYPVNTMCVMPPTIMTSGLSDYDMLAQNAINGNNTISGNYAQMSYGDCQMDSGLMNDIPMGSNFGMYDAPMDVQPTVPMETDWTNGCPTPPAEEYLDSVLAQDCDMSYTDEVLAGSLNAFAEPETVCEFVGVSKIQPYRGPITGSNRPRPIRSASEKKDNHSSPTLNASKSRDEGADKVKARSDPLYDRKPDKNGYYHCPMKNGTNCNHQPVKQKCIYAKNLDSHLRPYKCKFKSKDHKNECSDLRFSSNACLFRHEREAHGLHNHGLNPYLCEFPDCERARPDMGFPRRWNQRDHMKRVHDYEPDEVQPMSNGSDNNASDLKKRKTSAPAATPMKRSPTGLAKAQTVQHAFDRTMMNVARHPSNATYGNTSYSYRQAPYTIPVEQFRISRPQEVQFADYYYPLMAH